jgi:undecaprenyl-diphosphatase
MFEILLLAILQGIAEFLPISSSGHLVVGAHLLQLSESSSDINIVLHLGTLFSILLFYRKRILELLTQSERRVIWLLIVGTIPAVLVGLPVKMKLDWMMESLPLTGAMFPITGLILLLLYFKKTDGSTNYQDISFRTALIIGLAQAFALLPGISRSGSTIAAAIFCGVKRESAATFSFLLAIPVIAGAALLEIIKIIKEPPPSVAISHLAIGALISFAVGLAALAWLVKLVQRGKLYWFALWLIPLGITILVIWFCSPQLIQAAAPTLE